MSTSKGSGSSNGDGFWAKNGPSIMSATGSALSTTYKAGKFVGKSAYSAGKTHYNNQKGRKQEGESNDKSESPTSFTPVESLRPVDHFAPPPLKPGQMQYQKGGNTVAAGDKPLARQASYVSVSQPSPAPPQKNSPSVVNNQQVINPDALQPLYNADGQIIGYIPKNADGAPPPVAPKLTMNNAGPPPIAPRPAINNSGPPPIAPRPVSNREASPVVPARLTETVVANPTASSNPMSPMSGESDTSKKFEVTPYQYISPEDREKNTKIVIESKIDVGKMAPPPIHTGRGRNVEKKFSEIVDEKIKGLSPSTPGSSTSGNNSFKGISANNTNNSSLSDKPVPKPRKISVSSSIEKEEEVEKNAEEIKTSPAVLGKYDYSKKLEFQPPPKANVPEGFIAPSSRLANMKQESENKRKSSTNRASGPPPPAPARTGSSSRPAVPPPARNFNIPKSNQTANVKPPVSNEVEEGSKAAVLGSYDYDKPVTFLPPPSAKRSERDMEFISQKNERSRITTDRNMRYVNEQQRVKDTVAKRKLQVLQPEQSDRSEPPKNTNDTIKTKNTFGMGKVDLPPPPRPSRNDAPPSYAHVADTPPPKPSKPTGLSAPPKPTKPKGLSAPPKPKKPSGLVAPPKPKKPEGLREVENGDDNPFERYDPHAAV